MEESAAAVIRVPTAHEWPPVVVNRSPGGERRVLKVVAFNAQGGGALEQISRLLRRPPLNYPDLILLSEMDWRMRRSGRRESAAELAEEFAMSFAYIGEFAAPLRYGKPISFVGNAILSNWPLTDVRAIPLTRKRNRRRMLRFLGGPTALAAKIMVNRRSLAVGVLHLHSRWNPSGRALQVKQFLEGFPDGLPAIIGGDLNTTTVELSSVASFAKVMVLSLLQPKRFRHPQRWEPLFERLREAGFSVNDANVHGRATFTPSRLVPPLIRPKLDWLAVRGLKPIAGSAGVVPPRVSLFYPRFSDHDFVMCLVDV
jgi:endonuclease/exonuclease/phosphatase family metal-dependent hydrolase